MGMTPTRFWSLPETDQAYLVSYQRAKATIQGYEHYLAEKDAKTRKQKGKS